MPTIEGIRESHDQPQGLLAEGINHIYIHEAALGGWAVKSEDHAREMFMFLATVKFRQVIANILEPLGDLEHEVAAWEEDEAAREAAVNTLRGPDEQRYIHPLLWHAAISVISMDTGSDTSDRMSPIAEKLVPIGGPLVASCFEQNYHTYAFNEDGDHKMRGETGPISELAEKMGEGTGPRNLAVVHGPNGRIVRQDQGLLSFNATVISRGGRAFGDELVPVEPGIDPLGSAAYVREPHRDIQLPLEEVFVLDRDMRNGVVLTADVRIGMITSELDEKKRKLGTKRYNARVEHIKYLGSEVARVIGRHRLIRAEFYPQT